MAVKSLYKKVLKLKYTQVIEGKDKNITQSFANIKLDSTDDGLFNTGSKLGQIVNASSVSIEEDDSFTLESN